MLSDHLPVSEYVECERCMRASSAVFDDILTYHKLSISFRIKVNFWEESLSPQCVPLFKEHSESRLKKIEFWISRMMQSSFSFRIKSRNSTMLIASISPMPSLTKQSSVLASVKNIKISILRILIWWRGSWRAWSEIGIDTDAVWQVWRCVLLWLSLHSGIKMSNAVRDDVIIISRVPKTAGNSLSRISYLGHHEVD